MVTCPDCKIGLQDNAVRCPLCQRRMGKSLWTGRVVRTLGISAPFLMVLLVLLGSRKIESALIWRHTSPSKAYSAAVAYVEETPAFRGATHISAQKDSVIERWGPARYRVAGYVDLSARAGSGVHNYYSCVLHYTGQNAWEVEDLHFERVE